MIYPNREKMQAALGGEPLTEETARRLMRAEVDANEAAMATYKRISDFMLTDQPLPKTALRKVARGQIADSYGFDTRRWEDSWQIYTTEDAPAESDEALTA